MRCHYLFLSNSNVTVYEVLVSNTPPCPLYHKLHENKDALCGSCFQHLHSTWHKVRIHYTVFNRDQLSVPPWYTLEDLKTDFGVWVIHPKPCVKCSMLKQKKNITKCLLCRAVWQQRTLFIKALHSKIPTSCNSHLSLPHTTWQSLWGLRYPMMALIHSYPRSRSVVGRCVDHYHHIPSLSRHTRIAWIIIIASLLSNPWSFLQFHFSYPFEPISTETTFHLVL